LSAAKHVIPANAGIFLLIDPEDTGLRRYDGLNRGLLHNTPNTPLFSIKLDRITGFCHYVNK
ncbi:MAG TPA: hypothetical protein VL625_08825, partial [Patescibacteria group bacterium]|nr:hypothetical protein [Patescibacteria group bacterium]